MVKVSLSSSAVSRFAQSHSPTMPPPGWLTLAYQYPLIAHALILTRIMCVPGVPVHRHDGHGAASRKEAPKETGNPNGTPPPMTWRDLVLPVVVLIALNLGSASNSQPHQEITWQEFRTKMLDQGEVRSLPTSHLPTTPSFLSVLLAGSPTVLWCVCCVV